MGNIRSAAVKRLAKQIVKDFHDQLTNDFENNKKVVQQVTDVESPRMRNRIAGYVTRIYRRLQEDQVQVLESL